MCLGVPGQVVRITGASEFATATVDMGGIFRETRLAYLPDTRVGDWLLIHAGFAVTLLDDASAQECLALFAELGVLGDGPA